MGTIVFTHGTLIHGRQNVMGVFDADIADERRNGTTNADLTLYVRILFQQVNPSAGVNTYEDADGTPVPIRAWRRDEWTRWRRQFLRDCQRRWNGRFWLVTPPSYDALNWPDRRPTHRCHLYCRFEISEQLVEAGAHAVIPAVRVRGNHEFRSHMLLYSNRDLRAERLTRGSLFYTHIHEVGHLIGLEHPGTGLHGCVEGGEDVCYAAADGNDRDVMGRGSEIRAHHAKPWQQAAALLTGTRESAWTVSMRRVYPTRL